MKFIVIKPHKSHPRSCSGECEHTDQIKRLCKNNFGEFKIEYVKRLDFNARELLRIGEEFYSFIPNKLIILNDLPRI